MSTFLNHSFLSFSLPASYVIAPCPFPLSPSIQCSIHFYLVWPVSGMHVNCGNKGHPEEQLEYFSVSITLPVGKLLPGINITRTPKNTICSLPTSSHLSRGCHWVIQSQIPQPCKTNDIICGPLCSLGSILWNKMNLKSNALLCNASIMGLK